MPLFHSPSQIFTRIGERASTSFPVCVCLLNCSFRRRSKKTSKLWVTGLCAGNSPVTSEFPAQMASNSENVFIWWHHVLAHSNSIKHIKIIHFFLFHIEGHIKLEQYREKAHRHQIVWLSLYIANAMPADALVTLEARASAGIVLTFKARIFCLQLDSNYFIMKSD